MEFVQIKDEVLDLTLDSDDEEQNETKKEEIPQIIKKTTTLNLSPNSDKPDDSLNYTTQFKEELEEENDTNKVLIARSNRNVEKNLEKAVEEIKKGGSLSLVASYYGLSEDLIYQTLVSSNVTHEMDILTKNEEISLVKWILRRNKINSLVMKQHLLERVGKMKKVSKITPIFARSKFGRMWYDYFIKSNPEIVEDDGVLLPAKEPKTEPEDLVALCALKQAVVILIDFRKQKDFLDTLNCKVTLPAYLLEDDFNVEIKFEKPNDCFPEDGSLPMSKKNILQDIVEIKNSPSDDEISEENNPDYIARTISNRVKSTRKETNIRNTLDLKPICPELDVKNTTLDISDYEKSLSDDNISEDEEPDYIVKKISNLVKLSTGKKNNSRKTVDVKPTCEQCQRSFCNKAKLQRHLFSHIPKELHTVSCYKCLKRFPSKYHFLLHLKISHNDTNFSCRVCGKVFKHQTSMRRHFKLVHCTNNKSDESRFFICDICQKSFKYKNSLENHIMYGHFKENKGYLCNICNKRFIKRSLMLRHRLAHSKTKPLICTYCPKSFSRKYLLRRHIENCEKNKKDIIDECQKLGKEFVEEMSLE